MNNCKFVTMCNLVTYFSIVLLSLGFVNTDNALRFYQQKNFHEAQEISEQDLVKLAQMSDMQHFRQVLDKILVPRVVGTDSHRIVGDYISYQMSSLGWTIEQDIFNDKTPNLGTLQFRNIVAKLNPNADRFLVLACHYDSKYTREHVFVGATDSAVPCAMLINLAKVMSSQLNPLKTADLSLMFIFFDGEEAFREWGPTDSIYGARHLARKWHNTVYKDNANELNRIDVLVLLDLLGAPDPVFYNYFRSTEKWYVRLASAEKRLASLRQLSGYSRGQAEQTYFRLRSAGAHIEDDHIPFLKRNVDILHVIPSPFPTVWHTSEDDYSALDFNTIENLNKILRVFVAGYLHMKP